MSVSSPVVPARHVECRLGFTLHEPTVLGLQIAVGVPPAEIVAERFEVLVGGHATAGAVEELATSPGGRVHLVRADPGPIEVVYSASTASPTEELPPTEGSGAPMWVDVDAVLALRQSRYCPSDELVGFAMAELGHIPKGPGLGAEIAAWVFERLAYEPGSSSPFDTAIDTLVANAGVCRDFAHLTITLCRALGVPARLVSVYAPGLSPMDFHAVVEIMSAGSWEVIDPTRLAPRSSLVRIATGRDAADTAFATTLRGDAELVSYEVTAVIDGDLPGDDHRVRLALR